MSTKRPSHARADTESSLQNVDNVRSFQETEKPQIVEKGAEDGSPTSSGNDLPAYEGEDYDRRASHVVNTAEDLVTLVINVEDDPDMNPWTFRTFFLGTSKCSDLHCDKSEHL